MQLPLSLPRALSVGLVSTVLLGFALSADAQTPPCRPCGGLHLDDPSLLDLRLAESDSLPPLLRGLGAEPRLEGEARLYVSFPVDLATAAEAAPASPDAADLDDTEDTEDTDGADISPAMEALAADAARRATGLREVGATPWLRLVFHTPAPVVEHVEQLNRELTAAAAVAAQAGANAHFQIEWQPEAGGLAAAPPVDYAFLLKRASVAVTGALGEARVITGALPTDADYLSALYGEQVAAYVNGVAFAPDSAENLSAAVEQLAQMDPGKVPVLDDLPWPGDPWLVLPEAARASAQGFGVALFGLDPEALNTAPEEAQLPMKVLALEFQGDLSLDPYSTPEGAAEAWSFVRGEDLGLRIIARTPDPEDPELALTFPDPQLTRPARFDPATGEAQELFGQRRTAEGLVVRVSDPGPVALLRLERMSAEELEGLAGLETEIEVTDERGMTVDEVLQRLQAFEDAQERRIDHYRAEATMHLRFQGGSGVNSVEATFQGPYFFRRGAGFDWAWQDFFINGVRWRGKTIPEIPLIQPEKAAALPLVISFTKEYRYTLRGTAEVDGRGAWVVDFAPVELKEGETLYQGTVWVDQEHFGRLRTRALQLGLEGEVISNEETVYFTPVDEAGAPAPWSPESLWMPLRVVGQQLISVLNATTVVEKETLLEGLRINGTDFADQRQAVLESQVTMVRDTDRGLRYLVADEETGQRVVQEEFSKNRLFGAAGVFWDESLDFPLPLAGIDFFSFDYKDTGNQVNLFFGGALLTANIADPDFLGSKWDAGMNAFGIAVAGTDSVTRDDVEIPEEDVASLPASLSFFLGRPLGAFGKLDFTYSLQYTNYQQADDTGDGFVLPQDGFTNTLQAELRYARSGYRFRADGSFSQRSDWEPWGLPGSDTLTNFDPETEDYLRYGASFAKIWWLPRFTKLGLEAEYRGGEDLDRFSKYQFGFFADTRVHGYQNDKVRAEEAYAAHITYGFDFGELLRLQLIGDAAWATDEETGLEDEFLAGVGIEGTFIGPWETVIRVDLGQAVAGPDDSFSAFLAVLKLFR